MARPRKLKPDYCLDKASNRAYVRIDGRKTHLGDYGTQASRDEYDRLVGEWIAAGRQAQPTKDVQAGGVTVSVLLAGFWEHVQQYYRRPDGTPTTEVANMQHALRPVRKLYAATPAEKFGPLALAAVQGEMIRLGWCRSYINKQINRVRMAFKWGVSKELIPSGVYEALRTVTPLSAGRSEAREAAPVKPVAESHAQAIFSFLSPQIQAMVELQALTGMRPGEACAMRGCDVSTPKDQTWQYRPATHKTQHHGHERIIDLGPQARAIVSQFLKPDLQAYLFSPADAEATRRAKAHAARKTPLTCGNVPGSNQAHTPTTRPGDRYTVATYRRAIQRGCARAFPPPPELARRMVAAGGRKKKAKRQETRKEWQARLGREKWPKLLEWEKAHRFHPHQLRHTAATKWRKEFGADAALVLLGDRTTRMIDVYAEKDRATATAIMEKIG